MVDDTSGVAAPDGNGSATATHNDSPNHSATRATDHTATSSSHSSNHADNAENKDVEKSDALAATSDAKPPRSKAKVAILMFSLGLAVFLAALDITIITTALPEITEHFGSASGYTWIGASFLLGSAATVPLWGKLSDIWGRKPVLLLANVIFFIGSLISATAVNIGMLIGGRALQGVGAGGLVVLVNICIGDLFSPRERGQYYGIIGGVWALASAIGPLIGGAFTDRVSWRWCFYINLPVDAIAFVIILLYLDLQTPKTPLIPGLKAIDWPGTITITGGTLMLLFGLEFGGETYPWDSAPVICLIVFGVLTIIIFAIIEARFSKNPIIPGRIFASSRTPTAALGICLSHGITFIAGSYFLPLYFQASRGYSPIKSGVALLPYVLSLSLSSAVSGIIIRKSGAYFIIISSGLALMTVGFGLFVDIDAESSWAKLAIYQIIAGIGVGPNFQAPLIALQVHVPPRDIASATSTFAFMRQIASATSVVAGNVLFQNRMSSSRAKLTSAVGPKFANVLAGGGAGASVGLVNAIKDSRAKQVVREVYASSLRDMWILFVCTAALGLGVSFLIQQKKLDKTHEETKTGLAAEKEREVVRGKKSDKRISQPAVADGALPVEASNGTQKKG